MAKKDIDIAEVLILSIVGLFFVWLIIGAYKGQNVVSLE
jgi:hypothetical protein